MPPPADGSSTRPAIDGRDIAPVSGPSGRTRAAALGHGSGFWVVASAFLVATAFSSVPTPLYEIYQRTDGFSTFMVTVAFAAYALGVVVSLFLVGHISDWFGRRRMLLLALLIDIVAAVVFLTSSSLGVLIAARSISGVAVGMLTATATAHISELHAAARPGSGRDRAELVSTGANLGGFAVGTLASGLLAQYVGSPLRTPFVVFLGLLVLGALGVALVPETVESAERPAYRPQRVSVSPEMRPAFSAAAAAAFAAFAVLGLFGALSPGFLAGTLHHPSHALAGLVAALVFGSAAGAQMVLRRAPVRRQLALGLGFMSAGLVGATVAVRLPSLLLFLIGGILAGAGAGVLFKGTVSTVVGLSSPATRGESLAGLFLASYLGLTVPVLGLGIATLYVTEKNSLVGFSAFLLLVCAGVSRKLLRR